MLEKRRYLHGYVSPPYTATLLITILLLCSFSLWMLIGTPRALSIVPSEKPIPSYILLVPDNASSSLSIQHEAYSLSDLPINDESRLINLNNFKFTINHDSCNKSEPLLLIIIHTAPKNYEKRTTIRETWGKKLSDIVVLFAMGQTEKYHSDIIEENKIHNDIIQGNFIDAYRNMTYKHVMVLKWALYYCPNAKYILKLDDDVFVNTRGLLNFIKQNLSPWGARRLMICDPIAPALVQRSWRSKWRVSPQEYPGRWYPEYCFGWGILYSPDSVFLLYREAQKLPYFWIDDAHITGTVAINVNLTLSSINSLVLGYNDMMKLINDVNYHQYFLFGPPNLTKENIKALHRISSKYTA